MKEHIKLLGCEVEDCVTGFKGIVCTVAFDLYGCVQAVVTPPVKKKDAGEEGGDLKSRWFDTKRLKVLNEKRVMPLPEFAVVGGPAFKPEMRSGPAD